MSGFTWGYYSLEQIGNKTRIDALEPIEITDDFRLNDIEAVENIKPDVCILYITWNHYLYRSLQKSALYLRVGLLT